MSLGKRALVIAAALAVATAGRASASTYDVETYETGSKAAETSTWTANASMSPEGVFSLDAAVEDAAPGVAPRPTLANADAFASDTVTLEPGTYKVEGAFSNVYGAVSHAPSAAPVRMLGSMPTAPPATAFRTRSRGPSPAAARSASRPKASRSRRRTCSGSRRP